MRLSFNSNINVKKINFLGYMGSIKLQVSMRLKVSDVTGFPLARMRSSDHLSSWYTSKVVMVLASHLTMV